MDLRRRIAVAVPIRRTFAIRRQLAPCLLSWWTCSGFAVTLGRPLRFFTTTSDAITEAPQSSGLDGRRAHHLDPVLTLDSVPWL